MQLDALAFTTASETSAQDRRWPGSLRRSLRLMNLPLEIRGKFFFQGDRKVFLRGVSYGTFAPDAQGDQFPAASQVAHDFERMAALGVNCVRIYTVPPAWLLEQAAAWGHHLLVGLPWAEHVAFLDSPSVRQEVRRAVAAGARACAGQGTSLTLLVGNEIPADIVRWLGPKRVERFLAELADSVRQECPGALVSYANFPSTEFLNLDFSDFYAFNVYLHKEHDFRRYIARLHNLAHNKPLVLSEFGADSIREGEAEQARILDSKLSVSAEMGAAGTVVFAWTDEWFTGGHPITDWAFGVVTAERHPKAAQAVLASHYGQQALRPAAALPRVSVVVCAYNAERTLNSCLAALQQLRYPDLEVIVVDDGSRDRTAAICAAYPFIHLIRQSNQGLSAARNVGLQAASGSIVAYTDADCDVDPDWLTYLVATLESSGAVAAGGPNYPPPEDSLVPSCVAVSPGGPTHVLLDDAVAEHIAGCNMAFRADVLRNLGGFDRQFRAAGDDIDICWRLQDLGYTIAFSPAAMVWHYRRCRVRDYLKQQQGYGRAEARVFVKHPGRFNRFGQARWIGRIYGGQLGTAQLSRPFIYRGLFGLAPFQLLYQAPQPAWASLPLTLEWLLGSLLLTALLALASLPPLWGLLPLLPTILCAAAGAWAVPLDPRFRGARARLLVTLLVLAGPMVRS